MKWLLSALVVVTICFSPPLANGAPGPHEDVPTGVLPTDVVKGVMQKTLSPQGRFLILTATSTVRIFDTPEKIAQARAALEEMQNAPSLVSIGFIIKTGMHKVTTVTSSGDEGGYEIPVPNNYTAPQVVSNGRGYTIIPAMPYNFTTQPVGVVTTVQQTAIVGGVEHRFSGTTVYPKPAEVTVCAKVPDPAALHDWVVKNGAAPENEPAWRVARTEILVTPEHADDGLVLNLQPMIVVSAVDGTSRVIPLKACASSVVIKQGAPVTFDGFPGADADFYQAFLGAQESTGDAITSITAGATVDYVTQQAEKK